MQAALADAQKAAEDVRYASDQVARLRIVAPFDGTVQTIATQTGDTLRQLQPGDAVIVGAAIVTISAESGFVVRTKVDEQDIAGVRVGQRAIVSGEDLGTTKLPGHVQMMAATAQKSDDPSNTSRQVVTTVALDRAVPYLRDGMTVDVDIVTFDKSHVLAVPTDAVRRDANNKPFVLIVRDGLTVKRPIALGPTNDAQAVVSDGVSAHETVIAERNVGIVEGIRVTPTTAPGCGTIPPRHLPQSGATARARSSRCSA